MIFQLLLPTADSNIKAGAIYLSYQNCSSCYLLKITIYSYWFLPKREQLYGFCFLLNIAILQILLSTEDNNITIQLLLPTEESNITVVAIYQRWKHYSYCYLPKIAILQLLLSTDDSNTTAIAIHRR